MRIGGEGDHRMRRRLFLATLSAVAALGVAPLGAADGEAGPAMSW